MTDGQACYVEYKPTLGERFWRKLGFRHHHGDDVAEDDPKVIWQGWMQTRSRMHFDLRDRLRLLLTGRLELQFTYHLDTPSPDKLHTRLDWSIVPPGGRRD